MIRFFTLSKLRDLRRRLRDSERRTEKILAEFGREKSASDQREAKLQKRVEELEQKIDLMAERLVVIQAHPSNYSAYSAEKNMTDGERRLRSFQFDSARQVMQEARELQL